MARGTPVTERSPSTAELGHTVGAVVVDRRGASMPGVRPRLRRLRDLGVRVLVGRPLPAALEQLDRSGIAGELVLVIGDEPPDTARALLDEQIARVLARRVPGICVDPRWAIVEHGVDPARHRVTESLFTVVSGGIGIRGSVEEAPDFGDPLVLATGIYVGTGPDDGLLPGPDVIDVDLTPPVIADRRILDLRTGTLHRTEVGADRPVRSMRFASIAQPGLLAVRVEAADDRIGPCLPTGGEGWETVGTAYGGIGALAHEETHQDSGIRSVERLVAVDSCRSSPPGPRIARRRLDRATSTGFDHLLAQQRAAWARRWERVTVTVPDDPETELGLRFALFHLWQLTDDHDELAVGARGLTGNGYAGHVFWDADVFVLPALVTIDPRAAAAMVAYRVHRLPTARARARAEGREGARFPWESAYDGRDVTPDEGYVGGEEVPILTGTLEEHITADVAWAAVHHAAWTRPSGRLTGAESTLVRETAAYWASRLALDPDGSAHIRDVIGPDEYHERVDDNAFTNAMARWNLRTAARQWRVGAATRREWLRLADALVDGYDADAGIHEQFAGYSGLEPLLVRDLAEPPVAADVLAGRARVARSQVIKQPDVLMIHHLLPGEAAPGSLARDLAFYAPRTAHGSSLSPAAMALLHARAGQADAALELLRISLRIDLDDLGGTTSAGVHVGACGGAWQTIVRGFLGAAVRSGRLELDPVLPSAWGSLEVRFRCLGRDVRVRADRETVAVDASGPLTVRPRVAGAASWSTSSRVRFSGGPGA
ncbi:MAG TPA: glycosyl hydrolase family 65 protein [Nocardioides sp.]|nr:glycosyl hydrolase family 65 protein [Nocardioides sp.]